MDKISGKILVSLAVAGACVAHADDLLEELRESELTTRQVGIRVEMEVPVDCRRAFDVRKSEGDPALKGFMYSAVGWEIEPAADSSRTVAITAQAGELAANGVFVPDGSEALTVLAGTTGRGTCDWQIDGSLPKRAYRLTHTVRDGDTVDPAETLNGYLVLCDLEVALLHPLSQVVTVRCDDEVSWRVIDYLQAGTGIETETNLKQGDQTTLELAFPGHGTLSFEYRLSGGSLSVAIDGGEPEVIDVATDGWVLSTLAFGQPEEHSVVFTYTAGGNGTTAIRNVRWTEDDRFVSLRAARSDVRTDLREGVRTAERMEHVLPFTYSSTNWVGDAQGTAAKVTVVQLSGTDPAVTNWTDEVAGSFKVLVDKPGEGEKAWKAKKGVWKATFDILGADHREEAWFDLRDAIGPGFMLMVF